MEDSILRREFSRGGKVVDIQRNSTYAIVEYDSEEAAKHAITIDYYYEGKKLAVEPKKPAEKQNRKSTHSGHSLAESARF